VREIEGSQPPSHCVIPDEGRTVSNIKINDVMKTIIECIISYNVNDSNGNHGNYSNKKCNDDLENKYSDTILNLQRQCEELQNNVMI
jgi:hypothetical protein